jgi:DGQHR domain-containing protein
VQKKPADPDAKPPPAPRGYLDFKAIKVKQGERTTFIGAMPVFELVDRRFITPTASDGLSPEILKQRFTDGPVQRKTNPAHVQGILDYIVEMAQAGEPWSFNSIVLYSTKPLEFEGISIGHHAAGEARASYAFSVGEGLHRCLAWAVALDLAKVRGVRRPRVGQRALKRIERAVIPVVVVEERDLGRQKSDFNKLNQQKPLTSTVLALTDDSQLSELTKALIADVALFRDRIDLNNASVGARSDKLLSFAQLRFAVASYLLGRRTRNKALINRDVAEILRREGKKAVREDLKAVFTEVARKLGGLEPLQSKRLSSAGAGDLVRTLRRETLLSSSAAWRALFVALHEAEVEGVATRTALRRLQQAPGIWSRHDDFFVGALIDAKTGKLLSSRESIDAASDRLLELMRG